MLLLVKPDPRVATSDMTGCRKTSSSHSECPSACIHHLEQLCRKRPGDGQSNFKLHPTAGWSLRHHRLPAAALLPVCLLELHILQVGSRCWARPLFGDGWAWSSRVPECRSCTYWPCTAANRCSKLLQTRAIVVSPNCLSGSPRLAEHLGRVLAMTALMLQICYIVLPYIHHKQGEQREHRTSVFAVHIYWSTVATGRS